MSKEQIEEMAKAICSACAIRENCKLEDVCRATLQESETLYNAGYRKQEWISVDDRLPEKDVRVLVYIKSDRSYTNIDTDRLDDRGFVRWYKDVTHWMPLPEALK